MGSERSRRVESERRCVMSVEPEACGKRGDLAPRTSLSQQTADAVKAAIQFAAETVEALLLAVHSAHFVGTGGAATLFVTRIAMLHHDKTSMQRLKDLVAELQQEVEKLRKFGTFKDLTDDESLLNLLGKIEDYLDARDQNKADILRRVVVKGLIPVGADAEQEKNFRYAIRVLETEDVALLLRMKGLRLEHEEDQERNPNIVIEGGIGVRPFDPDAMFLNELPQNSTFSLARLQVAGLLVPDPRWARPAYEVTSAGWEFLAHLQKLEG